MTYQQRCRSLVHHMMLSDPSRFIHSLPQDSHLWALCSHFWDGEYSLGEFPVREGMDDTLANWWLDEIEAEYKSKDRPKTALYRDDFFHLSSDVVTEDKGKIGTGYTGPEYTPPNPVNRKL